jgi:2-polyprenyl-3-methyl-5-hydroxy-6-metoxy-1,4-benzoquinol methylase
MSVNYRSVLYDNYHSTQSGRAAHTDAKSLHEREKRRFRKEIKPLLGSISTDAEVFDLGCGSGSLLAVLKEEGFHRLMGMDLSPEQVAQAHAWGLQEVQEGDGLAHLKSVPSHWDLVLAADIIEHFTKDELVDLLQVIKSSLKKNGRLILRTPNMDSSLASVFAHGDFTHENRLNASSLEQVLLAVGFHKVDIRPSDMSAQSVVKEAFRKPLYGLHVLIRKATLFATGRSTKGVLFSPNMIAIAHV